MREIIPSRWFGITFYRFSGKNPRVWTITVRVGRKRKLEIEYR